MSTNSTSEASGNGRRAIDGRRSGDATAPTASDDQHRIATEPDALKLLIHQFRELGEYFSYYLTANADRIRLSLRNVVIWSLLGLLAFVAVGGLVVIGLCFLIRGIAEGLGALFDDRLWIGNLVTGFLLLAGVAFGTWFSLVKRRAASRERTVKKYEERQAHQEAQFGRSVSDQAADSSAETERAPVPG